MSEIEERLRQAEEIIRAKNRLIDAMYNSDLSVSWPRDADQLEGEYQERYGVKLEID